MKLPTEKIQNWSQMEQNKNKDVENTPIMNLKTSEKNFTHAFCDKKIERKDSVIVHELNHTDEKPFACKYCDKKLAQSSQLKDHEKSHTGVKTFACKFKIHTIRTLNEP